MSQVHHQIEEHHEENELQTQKDQQKFEKAR